MRLLVVDDHPIIRKAVAGFLGSEPDVELVGEAADGKEAVELACELNPDVILMDINMPYMNGIDATRAIMAKRPAISIIGLSTCERGDPSERLMQQAGAVGYVCKTDMCEALLPTLRASCYHRLDGGGPRHTIDSTAELCTSMCN